MNIIFMGTPDFAVPSLRALLDHGYQVIAVVTQPDRPKGRKKALTPPPVKAEALRLGIPVLQPEKLRRSEAVDQIISLQPDLIVTAAYGQIVPKSILSVPRFGCINVHASLLPKYRGGAPIHRAIMNGDNVTGVTIMYMAEGLDTGDMISKVEVPITDEDNTGTMHDKLSAAGAQLLIETLPDLLSGDLTAVPQNDAESTYAPNIGREDERIDWSRSSLELYNQVRGLAPWPGAFTHWNGEVLKVWSCLHPANAGVCRRLESSRKSSAFSEAAGDLAEASPGTVLRMTGEGIEVKTGDGSLWLQGIQPAGKRAMSVDEFGRGSSLPEGTVFGLRTHPPGG